MFLETIGWGSTSLADYSTQSAEQIVFYDRVLLMFATIASDQGDFNK